MKNSRFNSNFLQKHNNFSTFFYRKRNSKLKDDANKSSKKFLQVQHKLHDNYSQKFRSKSSSFPPAHLNYLLITD